MTRLKSTPSAVLHKVSVVCILFLLILPLGAYAKNGEFSIDYNFPSNDKAELDHNLNAVRSIPKSNWSFTGITVKTTANAKPGVKISLSLHGDKDGEVTINRVKRMKRLKGAIEEDIIHRQQKISSDTVNVTVKSIVVDKNPSKPEWTHVSFVAETKTSADADVLEERLGVPSEWPEMNPFQARELWKEVVSELAVRCFIPVEDIFVTGITSRLVITQRLTMLYSGVYKPTDSWNSLNGSVVSTLRSNGVHQNVIVLIESNVWPYTSQTASSPPPTWHSGNQKESATFENQYLTMTVAISTSLMGVITLSLSLGFCKRLMTPIPNGHHGGNHSDGHDTPSKNVPIADTILMYDHTEKKYWVLWKGYQRHKMVPNALAGKDRVQLPSVETHVSLKRLDERITKLYDICLEERNSLVACPEDSDEWHEFDETMLEAEHEHGMRPNTYALPFSVDRDESFALASLFRKRYSQLLKGEATRSKWSKRLKTKVKMVSRTSRVRKLELKLGKAPEAEL